ncbi:hypothetical protein [Tunicatimonas pelagia]|uniref:hypothetical protein n=1 Tax=Tunicatimonas pelagia TaxID=931531 RepID=UPI002665BE68|nr:hypothetical protein [Tunicatimonas pelagia]WKN40922.1 hypothetical protein P0M28_17960 [Tunicatimonas pelagia]
MAKHSAYDTFEAQKEKIQEIVEKLAAQFDLDEEDLTTVKEWGVALLVTGVSIYIIYQLIQRLLGSDEEYEEEEEDVADRTSAFTEMLKKQATLILIAVARSQIKRLFR